MTEITTVGVDLAKSVFQVHGIDAEGAVVLRRQLRRSQMLEFFQRLMPCLVGMEGRQGCATGSSNRWRRRGASLGA
ncbi:transposase (plasmid) [Phaeobacter piscinae]|uniref:Transposase n=1 Tax=Phaeobacter piscinae TaxID=1580596 RepID=A0ABM6PJ56_9RHOB|nr:transposase [Phaeobacter piscinae]AUQ88377.1 transposase [Phaeobacter piscinae]AUR26260.1 transposase [Phaeobacter piscinae]